MMLPSAGTPVKDCNGGLSRLSSALAYSRALGAAQEPGVTTAMALAACEYDVDAGLTVGTHIGWTVLRSNDGSQPVNNCASHPPFP